MDEEQPVRPQEGAVVGAVVVGADLSRLSVEELQARIAALQAEIARVEAALAHKQASRAAADAAFKL